MLSLKNLLNPAPSGTEVVASPTRSSPAFSFATEDSSPPIVDRPIMPKLRLSKEPSSLTKSKLRGPIRYPPFEDVDEDALAEIRRFQISPFGTIQQSSLHIPYNSGKKDFTVKTGRESFEVFRYEFIAPGHDIEYAVMWDYNVGLVRMTPFFKCCQYGKTMPAKMLGLNPGLKEITHSITGGAIAAQGYWMPYVCARAVCATFCYHIAGALIPIFGPTFPSECISPEMPEFGRMVIDPRLVADATVEADIARQKYAESAGVSRFSGMTSYPRQERTPPTRSGYIPDDSRLLHLRPRLVCDPAWLNDTDTDGCLSAPNSASSSGSGLQGYMITSRPSSGWASANREIPSNEIYQQANPYLTAVPRNPPPPPTSVWGLPLPRRLDNEGAEHRLEGSASSQRSVSPVVVIDAPDTTGANTATASPWGVKRKAVEQLEDIATHDAAEALLNLGIQEPKPAKTTAGTPELGSVAAQPRSVISSDFRRTKRARAASI